MLIFHTDTAYTGSCTPAYDPEQEYQRKAIKLSHFICLQLVLVLFYPGRPCSRLQPASKSFHLLAICCC